MTQLITTFSRRLVLMLSVWACIPAAAREALSVPVYDQSRPPLVLVENTHFSGIYLDLFLEILQGAGIEPTFVPVPKQRARIMFERGETLFSCCDNPAWRQRPEELAAQLFSEAFYWTNDLFIFPPGKSFPTDDITILTQKSVGVIRGYGYRSSELFGTRTDIDSEASLLQFLARGRADVGIVNAEIVQWWLAIYPGAIETGSCHDHASLHVRVHRSRADLLAPINRSIAALIQSGRRQEILNRYLPANSSLGKVCQEN